MIKLDSDLYRRWTVSAINCYNRQCRCEGCENFNYCHNPIKRNRYNMAAMKYSVLKLFERHGKPKEGINNERIMG